LKKSVRSLERIKMTDVGDKDAPQHNPVLEALKVELTQVDPEATPYVHSVIDHEIRKLSQESTMKGPPPNQEYIELNEKSRIKLMHKIYVPVDRYPGFNFVGKILGNKGENLKKIALETKTRIAILGQGSAKKNTNVQELVESGDPSHLHLKEPLHVRVESYGGCQHVWANMAKAMEALMPFMTPDESYTPPAPMYGGYGGYDPYAYPAYPEQAYPPPPPRGRGMRARGRGRCRSADAVVALREALPWEVDMEAKTTAPTDTEKNGYRLRRRISASAELRQEPPSWQRWPARPRNARWTR